VWPCTYRLHKNGKQIDSKYYIICTFWVLSAVLNGVIAFTLILCLYLRKHHTGMISESVQASVKVTSLPLELIVSLNVESNQHQWWLRRKPTYLLQFRLYFPQAKVLLYPLIGYEQVAWVPYGVWPFLSDNWFSYMACPLPDEGSPAICILSYTWGVTRGVMAAWHCYVTSELSWLCWPPSELVYVMSESLCCGTPPFPNASTDSC
jgi:hypothetical protein